MTHGYQVVHIRCRCRPLTFQHLPHCGTKGCILLCRKLVSSVCSKEVTTCIMSESVANYLQAKCFIRASKRWKVLHTANLTCNCLWCYGWLVTDHPFYSPHLAPSNFQHFSYLHKLLALKQFATATDVRQAVIS